MTSAVARSTALTHFRTIWTTKTPVVIENQEAVPPFQGPWVKAWVRHIGSEQASLGAAPHRIFERNAIFYAQVFGPLNDGEGKIDVLANDVKEIFEGKTINGLRFRAVSIFEIGVRDGWYSQLVEAKFQYDEEK